ncbi:MAG TPA: phosphoenolpyruvate synthase [Chitinophagaceae bacterium]|nr:phosphoenolpyruvate synthase [Chitinophagaceae bacterium]
MSSFIKTFDEISINDVSTVGGKNASLGEMFTHLLGKGIKVPPGFATTASAFWYFIDYNQLRQPLQALMSQINTSNFSNLGQVGAQAREAIAKAEMPADLKEQVKQAYRSLAGNLEFEVAVRSSATAEDLPQASFAGQHESFLNIHGGEALVEAVQKCFVSLFTDRAIKYRQDNGFAHDKVALSVGVQRMVRSDLACSGVGFTLEPESGFRDVIHLAGVWGLGENIVQGAVTPDEFLVFKPTLKMGKKAIIQKKLGDKAKTMVYASDGAGTVKNTDTPAGKRAQFVLTDAEITLLANTALVIEDHYQKPMDIEWAKDGLTGDIFIIQARPETVQSRLNPYIVKDYSVTGRSKVLCHGEAVGSNIAAGPAKVLQSTAEAGRVQAGDIIVTDITSPDWDPVLKKAGAIITNKGGRTSHASIVARELGVPAVVGTGDATENIKDGQVITVSAAEGKTGFVYEGKLEWAERILDCSNIVMPERTSIMMIAGDPDKAFKLSFYPNNGVGLMRIEFIITHAVKIHPMALVKFDEMKDMTAKAIIETLTEGYTNKKQYFIDKLAEGVAAIAAAFYPKDVIVRMSDFKTNEYANLTGGAEFEPKEENPMLGFRGASRYYHPLYKEGFEMECAAMKIVRDEMGLDNVKLMIPFCRTVEEGKKVISVMKQNGLVQGENGLEIYVMAEIPSNVILADAFAEIFDGFSIGSNDLTQLTLGIDRDSALVAGEFSEQDAAVLDMISTVVKKARLNHKKIGLCGQAPSDFPGFAQFLVSTGINSISFNPDALVKGIENVVKAEKPLRVAELVS